MPKRPPGALGRTPGTVNDETRKRLEMRKRFLDRCYKEADKIFDAQMRLALGHWQAIKGPDGSVIDVALKAPDSHALSWIMEQMWGRAMQPIELDAKLASTVQITDETAKALEQAIRHALPHADQS